MADLGRSQSRFTDRDTHFYSAPSGYPPLATPPTDGWVVEHGGRGSSPAVRELELPPEEAPPAEHGLRPEGSDAIVEQPVADNATGRRGVGRTGGRLVQRAAPHCGCVVM